MGRHGGTDGLQLHLRHNKADRGLKVKRKDERMILVAIKSRGNDPFLRPPNRN